MNNKGLLEQNIIAINHPDATKVDFGMNNQVLNNEIGKDEVNSDSDESISMEEVDEEDDF